MKINDIEISIMYKLYNKIDIEFDDTPFMESGDVIITNENMNLFVRLGCKGIEVSSKLDVYSCIIESVDELW